MATEFMFLNTSGPKLCSYFLLTSSMNGPAKMKHKKCINKNVSHFVIFRKLFSKA